MEKVKSEDSLLGEWSFVPKKISRESNTTE